MKYYADPEFDKKAHLYKTAYSPLFQCYIEIISVHKDDHGELIFVGKNKELAFERHLFRKWELKGFGL